MTLNLFPCVGLVFTSAHISSVPLCWISISPMANLSVIRKTCSWYDWCFFQSSSYHSFPEEWWICYLDIKYYFQLHNPVPPWNTYTTQSSQERLKCLQAELVSISDALGMMMWCKYFMEAPGYAIENNILYQDNKYTILLEKNGRMSAGKNSKHIKNRFFFSLISLPWEISISNTRARMRSGLMWIPTPHKERGSGSCVATLLGSQRITTTMWIEGAHTLFCSWRYNIKGCWW